jgi:hypothetical protein
MEEGEDLSGLIQEQQALTQAVEELLSRLQERLRQAGDSLEEEERRTLNELASKVKNPQLRQALQDIAEETDPEALKEGIEQALGLARELARTTENARSQEGEEPQPSAEETGEGQAFTSLPPGTTDEPFTPDREGTTQRPAGEETDEKSSDQDKPWGREDLDPYGGKKGAEAQDTSQEGQAGFVSTELAARIGSTGEFEEFITKGVPLEPGKSQPESPEHYAVNYEALRAILAGRSIPTEARAIVERYFKIITQGGP